MAVRPGMRPHGTIARGAIAGVLLCAAVIKFHLGPNFAKIGLGLILASWIYGALFFNRVGRF